MLNNDPQAQASELLADVNIFADLRKSGKESATEGLFPEKKIVWFDISGRDARGHELGYLSTSLR